MLAPQGRKHLLRQIPSFQLNVWRIYILQSPKTPHPQGWGYTDEARLRGLIQKIDFLQPNSVSTLPGSSPYAGTSVAIASISLPTRALISSRTVRNVSNGFPSGSSNSQSSNTWRNTHASGKFTPQPHREITAS